MEKTISIEPTAEEAAKIQTAIQQCFAEIEHLRERMRQDQADIEKSRARTRTMLAQLRTH